MSRLFAISGLITLLFFSTVTAGPMLRPGPEPEAGFAGVWRVIGAKVAPWAKPRKLTRKDAPLLEFAVDFAADEVKGPAPFACKDAKYSSGVTYQSEAFDGAFAGDKGRTLAKKLHLGDYPLSTHRVVCGNDGRDFYFDQSADLVTLQGDIVYTLERPTGMDPQQYTVGYSGPSFDCTAAKTTGERLFCIDAALSRSDKKLGEAYAGLKRELSSASLATFVSAQRAWRASVMESCGANVPMPETLGDRNVITECLNIAFADRVNLFDGLKAERAGKLVLEPRTRFRAHAKTRVEESNIYPWMTGSPRAAAFNAFIFKTMRLDRWRTDDKDMFRLDDIGEMRLFGRRVYTAGRFDGRIVSLQVSTDDFTGGNHDVLGQRSFTWDLAKARLITLDDVFVASGDWKAFVTARCKEELHKQFSEREAADLDDAEIADTLGDSGNWLWSANQATIVFLIGTISGMSGGEFDVDIPLKTLKPYMKPDAPVR